MSFPIFVQDPCNEKKGLAALFRGRPMTENNERRESAEHMTDEEIASTIRYLDPNPSGQGTNDETSTFLVICVSL